MISFDFKNNNNGLNFNSLNDFGIWLPSRPEIPRAERKINTYEVDGRDGMLTEDLETYKPIKIPLPCEIIDKDLLNTRLELLFMWLCGSDGELRFSHYDNRYFKVYSIEPFEVQESGRILNEFQLNFVCDSFKYVDDANTLTLTEQGNIFNFGYISKPYLKVYGSGNITLTINNKNIVLKSVEEYIELDTEMQNCFKGTQPTNDKMIGEFPLLIPGGNTITWLGTVTKIELLPRWRCL